MRVSRDLVLSVLRQDISPEEHADLLEEYAQRRFIVQERNRSVERLLREAQEEADRLMSQVLCEHEITKEHRDVSGGSDHSTECLICGEFVSLRAKGR